MQSPVQIEFDGVPSSDTLTEKIWSHMDHLEKLFPRITDARVAIGYAYHHHQKGNLFSVRIELNVPGKRLCVAREPGLDKSHKDVNVALRDAFKAMERQLRDYAHKLRREVKTHDSPLAQGRVSRILAYENYGFITTADEREIFFDANAVITGDFTRLSVGAPVRFVEELGEKGPQASTVYCQ